MQNSLQERAFCNGKGRNGLRPSALILFNGVQRSYIHGRTRVATASEMHARTDEVEALRVFVPFRSMHVYVWYSAQTLYTWYNFIIIIIIGGLSGCLFALCLCV